MKVSLSKNNTNQYIVKTLSHISSPNLKHNSFTWKETPSCTSCTRRREISGPLRASFTLEAALVIPMFTLFAVSVLFLFRVLQLQQDVEAALEYAAVESAIQAHGMEEDSGAGTLMRAQVLFRRQLKERNAHTDYVGTGGFSFALSDTEGSYVDLCVTYRIRNPIGFWGLPGYSMNQRARCHKWIGNTETGSKEERYAYKTEEGSVYHLYSDCAYLDLSIRAVAAGAVGQMRNTSGGIYQPCERCGSHTEDRQLYYVTDYGSAYHCSLSCSGLKRTVYILPLSELEGYPLCSKCKSRQGGG